MSKNCLAKRVFALLLALVMISTILPISALAETVDDDIIIEGDTSEGDGNNPDEEVDPDDTDGELEGEDPKEDEEIPEEIVGVDVSTIDELEQELLAGTPAIVVVADITVDRTLYVTNDVILFSDEVLSITRAADFAGDMFVVGQNAEGVPTENRVTLTLGLEGITQNHLLTIDGNKENTTVSVVGSALFICSTGKVNMYDGVTIKNNKKVGNERTSFENVTVSYPARVGGSAVILAEKAQMDIYGGFIIDNQVNTVADSENTCIQGGAIYNYGTLNIYGGVFSGNTAYFGGAFFNYRKMNIYHAFIQNNSSINLGGAIYTPNSTAAFTNIGTENDEIEPSVVISDNTAGNDGGAIYARNSINLGIVEFKNNTSSGYGGAIFAATIRMTMENTVFDGNTASSYGGAVYLTGSNGNDETIELTADTVTFKNNTSKSYAGAVYIGDSVRAQFADAEFDGNSGSNGGALFARGANVQIDGAVFTQNSATSKAGGIYTQETSTIVMNNVVATSNKATDGGFLYSTDTDLTVYDSVFDSNQAKTSSAVMALFAGATTKIYGSEFKNNVSGKNAGAITCYTSLAEILIHSTKFINNTCNGFGGALHVSGKSKVEMYCITATGNSGTHGGFMYETAASTDVTIGGLTLAGNTASTGGNNIWGNTVNADLFIDQSKCIETDYINARDDAYWNSFVANLLTVKYTTVDVPNYIDYYGVEIVPVVPVLPIDVTTAEQFEVALKSSNSLIRIRGNITLDRTLYVTKDTTIFAVSNYTITRDPAFAGDMFVVGQKANGSLCGDGVTLTLGQEDLTTNDLLVIDGNKANLTANVVGSALFVCDGACVNIYESVTLQNHKKVGNERTSHENVTVSYPERVGGSVAIIASGGAMNIYGGKVLNNEINTVSDDNQTCIQGAAIYNYGTTNIYGGLFEGNNAYLGGVFFNYRRMNIYKATIKNNTSKDLGGTIYVPNSTGAFTNIGTENDVVEPYVVFSGNSAGDDGGAIYARNSINIANTLFEGNVTKGYGGAISALTVRMTMNNVTFSGNTSGSYGGALYLSGSNGREEVLELTGNNVTFENNTSSSYAGAMHIANQARVFFKNATFTGNKGTYGGAVYISGGKLEIDDLVMSKNTSTNKGGAIYSESTSTVILNDVTANENKAADGGFMYSTNTELTVFDGHFEGNTATASSAVFALFAGATTKIYNSDFISNTSSKNAGAITGYTSEAEVLLQDCSFKNNVCNGFGGALHVSGKTLLTLYNITATGNSATHGGFMYHTSAGTVVTLVGLDVGGNTTTTGGPVIWGNTANAKLYIDKSKVKDSDNTGAYDSNYWAYAIANKLTVYDITQDIPKYLDYGNEPYPNMQDAVDVSSAEELEKAIADGNKYIRVVEDFELDRTFYITKDTTIFATFPRVLTRATNFGGDIFVVGEDANGTASFIKNGNPTLTLGNPDSVWDDLLTIDGNRDNMAVEVKGSIVFVSYSGIVNMHRNITVVNALKTGNERTYNEDYVLSVDQKVGGAVAAIISGTLNIYGGRYENNGVNAITQNEDGTNNYTSTYGGAIFNLGTTRVYDGIFRNNAAAYGGALLNYRIIEITGGTFEGNNAYTRGGAIYVTDSASCHTRIGTSAKDTTANKVSFIGNSAVSHGGAIYSSQLAALIIYGNTSFENNTTTTSGGAICAYGTLTARDITFKNNIAVSRGGAVYISNSNQNRVTRFVNFERCTFDGNQGYYGGAISLYAASSEYPNGGIVTATDCVFTANQAVKQTGGTSNASGGAIFSDRISSVTLRNSSFTDNTAELEGGAMYFSGESDVELTDCTVKNSYAGQHGGAISVRSSYLDIINCDISQSSCINNGGTMYIAYVSNREMNSKVNIVDSAFSNSQSIEGYGGFIYATKRALENEHPVLSVKNTTFNGGSTAKSGGAIMISNGMQVYFKNVDILNSTALGGKGGALYTSGGIVEYDGGTISGCSASTNGGGIECEGSANITLNKITASNNTATGSGGFMYANNATIKLYNSTVSGNSSDGTSGGIYAQCTLNVYNTLFENNRTIGNGGAITVYTSGQPAVIQDCTFKNNSADDKGGALYVSGKSLLNLYNITATDNNADLGGFMLVTTTGTEVILSGAVLSDNTAVTEGPIICGNSTGAVLKIDKSTSNYDNAYWSAAVVGELTVEETAAPIPTYKDYKPRAEEEIVPSEERTPVSVDEIFNLAKNSSQAAINSTYAAFPRLDNSSNFMSSNVTKFENINGGTVTVDTIVYPAHSTSSNMNFSQGMLIYQAMLYKQAHPEEEVNIHITSYRFSVQAGLCLNRDSRYFGYMRQLPANVNYDEYGFVRIAYLLVSAAKMGINVTVIGQQDAYPIAASDLQLENYFDYYLSEPCDPAYATDKTVGDFMNWQHCRWTLKNKGGTDMMHLKLCAVSDYLDMNGVEHKNALWTSSSNLDGITAAGVNANWKQQTATIITNHEYLYRIAVNYVELMAGLCGQEEIYEFQHIMNNRSAKQIDLLLAGRGDEIPPEQLLAYVGTENDDVFELYFTPMGGSSVAWDEDYNAYCKYMREMYESEDYIIFIWNAAEYSGNYSLGKQMEDMIVSAFHDNKNPNNKVYMNTESFDGSAFDDLLLGQDIGLKSFNLKEFGGIHNKDVHISYQKNGQRYYVNLLNSMNVHSGSMYYQANHMLVIKETDCDEDSVFFTIADRTARGIVEHAYGDRKVYISEENEHGYYYRTCDVCGKQEILGTAHRPGEWITDRESSNVSSGIQHKDCTVCGVLVESREFNKEEIKSIDFSDITGRTFTVMNDSKIPVSVTKTPATIEALIQIPTTFAGRAGVIVGNYTGGSEDQMNLEIYNGGLVRLYVKSNGNAITHTFSTDIRSDRLTHIAVTVNGNIASLYVGGVLKETAELAVSLPENMTKFTVGGDDREGNAQYFKGTIYAVHMFGDARTTDEIRADAVMVAQGEEDLLYSSYYVAETEIETVPGQVRPVGQTFSSDRKMALNKNLDATPKTFEATLQIPLNIDAAGVIVGNYSETTTDYINLEIVSGGKVRINSSTGSLTFDTDIRSEVATHIAVSVQSTTSKLYVNGVLTETKYLKKQLPETATNFVVGGDNREGNTEYFKGYIYSVNLFSDIRLAAEVKADATMVTSDAHALLYSGYFVADENENTVIWNGKEFTADTLESAGNLSATPHTLEAVISLPKTVDDRGGTVIGNYSKNATNPINLEIYYSGFVRLFFINDGVKVAHMFKTDIRSETPTHIAVTVEGNTAILYVNGIAVETATLSAELPESTDNYVIGGDNRTGNTSYFKGTVYAVYLFEDVRTAEEVKRDASAVSESAEGLLLTRNYSEEDTTAGGKLFETSELTGRFFEEDSSMQINDALASTPHTIEAVIKLPKSIVTRGGTIVGNYKKNAASPLNLEIYDSGRVRLYFINSGVKVDCVFKTDIRSNNPTHIAVTINGTEAMLYVNGILAETATLSAELPESTENFVIGGDNRTGNTSYFKGAIYSVNLFEDVRTAEEIARDVISVKETEEGLLFGCLLTEVENNGVVVGSGKEFTNAGGYELGTIATKPLSIEALVHIPRSINTRAGVVVGNYDLTDGDVLNLEIYSEGRPRLYFRANGVSYSYVFSADIRSDVAKHIALTIDGKKVTLYVDGVATETKTMAVELPTITEDFKIGSDNRPDNSQYFKGTIYSVALFGDIRTAEEITQDKISVSDEADNLLFNKVFEAAKCSVSGSGEHLAGEWETDLDASDDGKGIEHTNCVYCGNVLEIREIGRNINGMKIHYEDAPNTYTLGEAAEQIGTLSASPMTFEAVVQLPKSHTTRGGVIFGNYDGGSGNQINLEIYTSGRPRLYFKSNGSAYTYIFKADIRSDNPVHIALTVDGNTAKLYVDGVLKETATMSRAMPEITEGFCVGGDNRPANEQYFQGGIYAVNIFSDVRTAEEIALDRILVTPDTEDLLYSFYVTE